MTTPNRHVLCAVDYSAFSITALRAAAIVAKEAHAHLTVVTVNDPLLVEAMRTYGDRDWPIPEQEELRLFCREALDPQTDFDVLVRVGHAADHILMAADSLDADLLVMGCQGLRGIRKMFFGSTTERVLRHSERPVLVTPSGLHLTGTETLASLVRRVLVPVDLSEGSAALVRAGAALGGVLKVPVLVAHGIEPVHFPGRWQGQGPSLQIQARERAEAVMQRLVAEAGTDIEPIVLIGDAAETIVDVADVRGAGLILMGLRQSGLGRVGVVAYRVLCRTHVPVLALPAAAVERFTAMTSVVAMTSAS